MLKFILIIIAIFGIIIIVLSILVLDSIDNFYYRTLDTKIQVNNMIKKSKVPVVEKQLESKVIPTIIESQIELNIDKLKVVPEDSSMKKDIQEIQEFFESQKNKQ